MKINNFPAIVLAGFFCFACILAEAQVIDPKEAVKEQGTNRVNNKIEEGIDAGFNKIEEGIGSLFSKKKKNRAEEPEIDSENQDDTGTEETGGSSQQPSDALAAKQQLVGTTQYDFVPGDKILYFDDFSQDAIGDFPTLWTTNGSGEVKTVNIAEGHWFHMNGTDAGYSYAKMLALPENFIFEFDIIPDAEYEEGQILTFYQEDPENPIEMNVDLYPGIKGLHIAVKKDGWEAKGYWNDSDAEWLTGQSNKNPVLREQVNHIIIWIQKRRLRIYHQGAKALDLPTTIYQGTVFNRFRFSGWGANSFPMVSNLKITTASPDTRSKLITEGKLVTYGITFDVNKADIKPESCGSLKSIADVLKENAGVKVKIVGHTDSDGDDAMNMELSKRRADSVKSELASTYGIDPSRMETEGAGESRPVAPNDTPVNKAQNRRVEFVKL